MGRGQKKLSDLQGSRAREIKYGVLCRANVLHANPEKTSRGVPSQTFKYQGSPESAPPTSTPTFASHDINLVPNPGVRPLTSTNTEAEAHRPAEKRGRDASKPTEMAGPEVSHGRGGAGNINPDDTQYVDGEVVRVGVEGSHEDGAFSTGRGGETFPFAHFPFHLGALSGARVASRGGDMFLPSPPAWVFARRTAKAVPYQGRKGRINNVIGFLSPVPPCQANHSPPTPPTKQAPAAPPPIYASHAYKTPTGIFSLI